MSKIVIDRDAAAQDAEERARPAPTVVERERATMTATERGRARAADAFWSGALAEAAERTIRGLRRARWINAGPGQRAAVLARLRSEQAAHAAAARQATAAEIDAVVASWVGHARHADTWRLRGQILAEIVLVPQRVMT